MKLEAKLKEEEILKQKKKIHISDVEDDTVEVKNGETELNIAEGVMRRNSSYVDLT
jgi:hypothetical protein